MKIIAGLIVALAIGVFFLVPQVVFVVDETEVAIVTRFGELQGVQENPGLNFKTPFVEKVTKYEKRLLIFDAPPQSMLTRDKKRLEIDVYARGRIVNPRLFRETVFTEANAATVAIPIISSSLREEIAKDDQIEIIAVNREEIMIRVRDAVAPQLVPFGIEVIDIRIKRADFPATIADSVYARMQAERKRIADRERAEGAERDAEVRASVDREAAIIRAEAERDAQITRGEGEAESVKIFAEALQQDPDFYAFQRSLQAYRIFLPDGNTTLVLPADSELFQFLQSPMGSNR
jgi:membrane protease subunit HflC